MPLHPDLENPTVTEEVFFPAESYLLHGELAYPQEGLAHSAIVLAGPHPLLGGNMRNNVMRCLGDGLAQKGQLTLRFDYRGVGRSQGPQVDVARHLAVFWQTSHAPGEMDFGEDLQGAVEFIRQAAPGLPLALVGYSFGCALLPFVRQLDGDAALVLIAPTVAKHNYNSYLAVKNPTLVIVSEDDFATDCEILDKWFGSLSMPRELVRKLCDNHFFRGYEYWLTEIIYGFLKGRWRR